MCDPVAGLVGEPCTTRNAVGVANAFVSAQMALSGIRSLIPADEAIAGHQPLQGDPFLAGTGSEQNASARITIEQQLTRDLTVTYITNVTSTQQQVIQVQYNVNREVSLIFLRNQNGTFGLDIKFKKRFR